MEIYQLEQFRTTVVSSLLMPQIAAELPESTFEVVNCPTQDLIAGLQDGRFDVLIATDICRSKSTKWMKLYVEQAFLSAPLAAGFANREAVGSEEMRRLSFSIEAGLPGYSDWYAYLLRNVGVDDSSIESTEFKEHLRVKDTLPTCNLITSFIMSFLRTNDARTIVRIDEGLSWADVSLHRNPFDDVIARIAFDGTGMYGRENSPTSPEFATSGSFAKCWVREGDRISLLKRGSEGYANAGFEPYSEALAASLLAAAKVDHVPYGIVRYRGKLASKCPLFTTEDVGFVSAHRFFEGTFGVRDMLEFCARHGAKERFREMVVMDAVMANVDHHAGNYGFLVDNACGRMLSMAPLFDHNMACLPMMMEGDDFDEYVGLIGPKIGTDFTAIGREFLTPSIRAKLVALKDFAYEDPGLGYPAWKLEAVNRLKDRQIAELLA